MADLDDYEWLTGPEAARLLDDFALVSDPAHQLLSKLRKQLSAERARLAAQLVDLRRKGATKFGDLATGMFFGDIALQQATDLVTARYKASRVGKGVAIADYCCGIGGDLLAFAERGPATGWDWSEELAHLANANLRVAQLDKTGQVCVGDVAEQTPAADAVWHLDPDRRVDGRRSTQIQWHSPGPELVDRWLETSPNGIIKLAPATDLPDSWSETAEREWVTQNRQCRQQIAWFGELASASGQHTATLLPKSPTPNSPSPPPTSFTALPNTLAPSTTEVGQYLYDTDPSLRAARLTGALAAELDLHALKTGATYLTNNNAIKHPLLTRFQVLEKHPLRISTLAKHLRSLKIGRLEIKKRGVDTDPERLRKKLKLNGDQSATLLLTRIGNSEIAVLARRDEG